MSDNTDNKIVENVVESVVESSSKINNSLYLIGGGIIIVLGYFGVKKYFKKNNDVNASEEQNHLDN